jgi:hypothetical protein
MRKAKWIVAAIAVVALVVLLRYTLFAPDIVEVRTAAAERGLVEETVTNTPSPTPVPAPSRFVSGRSCHPRLEAWWWPFHTARATG